MVFSKLEQVAKYWDRSGDLWDAFDVRYVRAICPLKTMSASYRALKWLEAYRVKYIDQADKDSSGDVETVITEDI